ncbi:MAG: hypothetical protein K6A23_12110 [Butyrivibrio sp.]|nr:hypothetical protein [Butyrivibrio sp.]
MGSDKVFRLSVITIISAFILILVIVYATNTDKFSALWNRKDTDSDITEASSISASGVQIEQIGDNLTGYLVDSEFFDEYEAVPKVVITVDNIQNDISGNSESESSDNPGASNSYMTSGDFTFEGQGIPAYPENGEVPQNNGAQVGNPPNDNFEDIDSIDFKDIAH